MIVAQLNGRFYRCLSAFLENAKEQIRCTVTTLEEVAAFLRLNPDEFFSLVPGLTESLEGQTPTWDVEWCWCGLVKWEFIKARLYSKRFNFDEAELSPEDLDTEPICPGNA